MNSIWIHKVRKSLFLIISMILLSSSLQVYAHLLEVEGALLLKREENFYLVRSYSPKMNFTLAMSQEPLFLQIENVMAHSLAFLIEGEKEVANLTKTSLSPTQVLLQIQKGEGLQNIQVFCNEEDLKEPVTFAILGDNQGNNETLAKMIQEINQGPAQFFIHLGDMVPSGHEREYEEFLEIMALLEIPYYTVLGNHDIRGEGYSLYQSLLAPSYYSFDFLDYSFLFLDTSLLGIDDKQHLWFKEKLARPQTPTLIFKHVPLLDPRGRGHAFLDKEKAYDLLLLITESYSPVRGVFAGHIHMYYQEERGGIPFVISGGGGAPLYASRNEGGFHHYCLVEITGDTIHVSPYQVTPPVRGKEIVISGRDKELEIFQDELLEMITIEREGEFQNFHGNFPGGGLYSGIPVKDLLEMAGGMEERDILRVHSYDGYMQEFLYPNIYPDKVWYQHQGDMVLAVRYENETLPEWIEGYRLAFLPEDGSFSNEDFKKTSLENRGWYVYPSAGSQWIKMVTRLEVVPWERKE